MAETSESGPGSDLASSSDMAGWLSLRPGPGRAGELAVGVRGRLLTPGKTLEYPILPCAAKSTCHFLLIHSSMADTSASPVLSGADSVPGRAENSLRVGRQGRHRPCWCLHDEMDPGYRTLWILDNPCLLPKAVS